MNRKARTMRTVCLTAVSLLASVLLKPTNSFAGSAWVVKKERWSAVDEKNYSDFVEKLGSAPCNTVDSCLKSSANPYRSSDPSGISFVADCAKLPYLLRTYFAWKNGLPFSFSSAVAAVGNSNDLRYSPDGNVVIRRRSLVPDEPGLALDGRRALSVVLGNVSSSMFRIHPYRDDVDDGLFSDFYMAKVDREQIRPGTIIYDPAGHVAVVYKIEADGRVRYFDSHPDNTVSHGVYGSKFVRSRPGSGAGFKNFRSLQVVNFETGSRGEIFGGSVTTAALNETEGFSDEQFFGTEAGNGPHRDNEWKRAVFSVNGRPMNFQDFVRTRLAIGELRFHPIEELQNAMDSLCGDLQDRVIAVAAATSAGIHLKAHPDRLPRNIYGTSGEWEDFSSPSRDARLKTSFLEVRQRMEKMVKMYQERDPRIDYQGTNLAEDLRAAYNRSASACTVEYTRSNGSKMKLSYDEVVRRLFAFSFDPYHCIELRWGASTREELSTCEQGDSRASADKLEWYSAEQRLRNQIERTYDARMDFTRFELVKKPAGSGVDQAPNVDLRAYLSSLR